MDEGILSRGDVVWVTVPRHRRAAEAFWGSAEAAESASATMVEDNVIPWACQPGLFDDDHPLDMGSPPGATGMRHFRLGGPTGSDLLPSYQSLQIKSEARPGPFQMERASGSGCRQSSGRQMPMTSESQGQAVGKRQLSSGSWVQGPGEQSFGQQLEEIPEFEMKCITRERRRRMLISQGKVVSEPYDYLPLPAGSPKKEAVVRYLDQQAQVRDLNVQKILGGSLAKEMTQVIRAVGGVGQRVCGRSEGPGAQLPGQQPPLKLSPLLRMTPAWIGSKEAIARRLKNAVIRDQTGTTKATDLLLNLGGEKEEGEWSDDEGSEFSLRKDGTVKEAEQPGLLLTERLGGGLLRAREETMGIHQTLPDRVRGNDGQGSRRRGGQGPAPNVNSWGRGGAGEGRDQADDRSNRGGSSGEEHGRERSDRGRGFGSSSGEEQGVLDEMLRVYGIAVRDLVGLGALVYAHVVEAGLDDEWQEKGVLGVDLLKNSDSGTALGILFNDFLRSLPKGQNRARKKADALWDTRSQANFGNLGLWCFRMVAEEGMGEAVEVQCRRLLTVLREAGLTRSAGPSSTLRELVQRVNAKWEELQSLLRGCYERFTLGMKSGAFLSEFGLGQQLMGLGKGYLEEKVRGFLKEFPRKEEGTREESLERMRAALAVVQVARAVIQQVLAEVSRVVPVSANAKAKMKEIERQRVAAGQWIRDLWVAEPEALFREVVRKVKGGACVLPKIIAGQGEGAEEIRKAQRVWGEQEEHLTAMAIREQMHRPREEQLWLVGGEAPIYDDVLPLESANEQMGQRWLRTTVAWAQAVPWYAERPRPQWTLGRGQLEELRGEDAIHPGQPARPLGGGRMMSLQPNHQDKGEQRLGAPSLPSQPPGQSGGVGLVGQLSYPVQGRHVSEEKVVPTGATRMEMEMDDDGERERRQGHRDGSLEGLGRRLRDATTAVEGLEAEQDEEVAAFNRIGKEQRVRGEAIKERDVQIDKGLAVVDGLKAELEEERGDREKEEEVRRLDEERAELIRRMEENQAARRGVGSGKRGGDESGRGQGTGKKSSFGTAVTARGENAGQ